MFLKDAKSIAICSSQIENPDIQKIDKYCEFIFLII